MQPVAGASFWQGPVSAQLDALGTTPSGLASSEAARRLAQHGANDAAAPRRPPAWVRLGKRFANPLVLILLLASALSAATGDVASFAIVTGIVLLSVALDFVQETRAGNAVDALRSQVAPRAEVCRDGAFATLPTAGLVPGDLVRLTAGDIVPADGRLLSGRGLVVNQALLTGEAYPAEKRDVPEGDPAAEASGAVNAALAGTSVVSGIATMLVCRTGRDTALGSLAGALVSKPPPTAYEAGLRRFSMLILRITAVLVLVVLGESLAFHRPWLDSLIFALALAVGLTPELLPAIMTVTLARGALRLSKKRVIVTRLAAIHNLGAMDVLCTDKTGTLTEARIALTHTLDSEGGESEAVFQLAWLGSHFSSGLHSPLDDAVLARHPVDPAPWTFIDEVPFDFERRRASVLLERDGARTMVVKGAPEDIIRLCTSAQGGAGCALTDAARAGLLARFEALGADGLRVLGIATRACPAGQAGITAADEAALAFAGFAVFLDPPKASAGAALAALARAGVAVKVLTGDNEKVARHLCGALGFDPGQVVAGPDLAALDDPALDRLLPGARLFCRVTPEQKLRVILALKRLGQTVGYMGDGINDAPALHAADVGISVDSGADVAKAAAEVILLDQDLGVVLDGVVEGRRTVVNTGKYILMAGSANFGNICSMVLAGLVLPFLPLLPIQVLLTNLVFDAAQTGLPFDRVDAEAVAKPIHWDMRQITRFMLVLGPVSTAFDVLTFGVLLWGFHAGEALFRTGWFVESLLTQILVVFAVRTRRHLFASRPHPAVAGLALGTGALAVALPFLPGIAGWFDFVPLPAAYFAYLLAATGAFLVVTELVKRAFYHWAAPVPVRLPILLPAGP